MGFIFPAGSKYWVTTAAVIGTLGLANRYFRKWILAAWEMIGIVLGWINSRIILSIVFTFFLVPIGFLYKLIKGDLLFLKKSPPDTIFTERNHTYEAKDLENPW